MENPVPVQPSEDIIPPAPGKKYLSLSILAGCLYGIPTGLIGFAVIFLLLLYLSLTFIELNIPIAVIVGLAVFIGLISAGIAGVASGRTSFQHANEDGTPRTVGYGILSCAGIGVIGLLVFPILCSVGYFLMLSVVDKFGLLNDQLSAMLVGGGSESGVFLVLAGCLIPMATVLAYVTAVLFGGVIYRGLSRKNKLTIDQNLENT